MRSVYGESLRLPFDLSSLRWFWWWAPGSRNLTRLEVPVWRSLQQGDIWVPGLRIERHLSQGGFFVNPPHGSRSRGFPHGSMVEVMRVSHPPSENPHSAYGPEAGSSTQVWYWHAPGSGVYLSLGRTLSVANRSALLRELAVRIRAPQPFALKRVEVTREAGLRRCEGCTAERWQGFEVVWTRLQHPDEVLEHQQAPAAVCDLVRTAKFDTIQLYAAFGGQRFEIVDCRATRGGAGQPVKPPRPWTSACAPLHSSESLWVPDSKMGMWKPCSCSASLPFLNCGTCVVPAPVLRIEQPSHTAFSVLSPRNDSAL